MIMGKKAAICLCIVLVFVNCLYMKEYVEAAAEGDAINNFYLSTDDLLNMDELYGWASVSGDGIKGVTGGGNAIPQVITTLEELTRLAAGNTPRVIVISGTITCGAYAVNVGSNKTIVGIDKNAAIHGGINMDGVSNIIVSNLNFQGFWPDPGPDDCISARNSDHLWFNHLNIWNAVDGNMDLTIGSDYITVSWCKFWYTNAAHDHRLSCLTGSGTDHDDTDMGRLNVTYHHNWFANLVAERMPRILYGQGHIYNNYYTAAGDTYCIGAGCYASVLIENNYFNHVNNPHQLMYTNALPAYIVARGNIYNNTKGRQDAGLGGGQNGYVAPFFNPPYPYDMDDTADIPAIVPDNAGPHDVLEAVPPVSDNPITYDESINTYFYHGQNSDGSNASIIVKNPFKGLDLDETPQFKDGYPVWKKGVTISYWTYLPADAADAAVLNFNLENNRQIYAKDKVKYNLCQGYRSSDPAYSMGVSKVYRDAGGKEYTVLSGYGQYVRYNPSYPAAGCYAADPAKGVIPVYLKGSDPDNTANWTYIKYIGSGEYDKFGKKFDEAGGENSQVSEACISGSLSLYASGTAGFRQDDLTGLELNPNLSGYNRLRPVQIYNQLYYWGNGSTYTMKDSAKLTPTMKQKGKWHFVVAVIQNDWIQFYMDGKEITTDYLNWWGQSVLNKYVAGRTFNLGYGMKKLYMTDSPAAENGTSMTIMDFISNKDTVLTIGGLGRGAAKLGQNTIGTPDGVKMKDLKFYGEPVAADSIQKNKLDTDLIPLNF